MSCFLLFVTLISTFQNVKLARKLRLWVVDIIDDMSPRFLRTYVSKIPPQGKEREGEQCRVCKQSQQTFCDTLDSGYGVMFTGHFRRYHRLEGLRTRNNKSTAAST